MIEVETFDERDQMYDAATRKIADALIVAARRDGVAGFAAAGGSTPGPIYQRLGATARVPWEKVLVTLTDERQVPAESDDRNAKLVRRTLFRGAGNYATFVPLDGPNALIDYPMQCAATLLGMGSDGHIASIFPQGEGMMEARQGLGRVYETQPDPLPAGAPYPRWTMSMAALKASDCPILAIVGEDKKAVIDGVMTGNAPELPVADLINDPTFPLTIYWAP